MKERPDFRQILAENQMRHNKIIGWEGFFEVMESVHRVSPWLSRQIAKRASEWPFWYSGVHVVEWSERQIWLRLPKSFRNTADDEICQGHLLLGAELGLRLLLLRDRQEIPFRYRVTSSRIETHHPVNQSVDLKFHFALEEWERIRLEMARAGASVAEFTFAASLADGKLAALFTFHVAFELEKFLTT